MVLTKGCPRCQGDLIRMHDDYEPYMSCLQCGHTIYEQDDRHLLPMLMGETESETEDAEVVSAER